jgi:hypothetical protein
MKVLKHFADKILGQFVAITCRHGETRESSCPFTERKYTICVRCGQIIKSKHFSYQQQIVEDPENEK